MRRKKSTKCAVRADSVSMLTFRFPILRVFSFEARRCFRWAGMEILIRLFVWILNRTYRRQGTSLYGANPMDEHVLQEYESARQEERNAERQQQVVATFQSAATPVQGAVDYSDM